MAQSVLYLLAQYPVLSQTFVQAELVALKKQGWKVGVASIQPMPAGVFQDEFPVLATGLGVETQRLMREFGHIHTHFADTGVRAVGPLAASLGIPWSVTVHAYDLFRQPGAVTSWRELPANCKAVVTISRFHKQFLMDRGLSGSRIVLLPNAVELQALKPHPSERLERLIAIGRPTAKKGFSTLLLAWSLLAGQRPSLTIVGGKGFLKEPPLGLRLLPMLPYREVMEELAAHDLLVAPCIVAEDGDMDGIPTVLVEALAMQKAVIASRLSGVPDLVWDSVNGLLVPPGNAHMLASAIARLVKRPDELRRLGSAGPVAASAHDSMLVAEGLKRIFGGEG
jgi:glycosyltransferase involved in cell wall biosynthesis